MTLEPPLDEFLTVKMTGRGRVDLDHFWVKKNFIFFRSDLLELHSKGTLTSSWPIYDPGRPWPFLGQTFFIFFVQISLNYILSGRLTWVRVSCRIGGLSWASSGRGRCINFPVFPRCMRSISSWCCRSRVGRWLSTSYARSGFARAMLLRGFFRMRLGGDQRKRSKN